MERLGDWLRVEGVASGGLGPSEAERIDERHLADSLAYIAGWPNPPVRCLDLGSGLGLPGLVLAVAWPHTELILVDRSEKRCDLARRAARVAGIEVLVVQADLRDWPHSSPAAVSRAAMSAESLRPVLERLLDRGGRAVISGDGSPVEGFSNLRVLDQPTRLLMMQRS